MWVTLHKRSGISHLFFFLLCSHNHDIFPDCFFFQTGISPPRDNFLSLYHWYRLTVSASMIRREPSSIFVIFIRHLRTSPPNSSWWWQLIYMRSICSVGYRIDQSLHIEWITLFLSWEQPIIFDHSVVIPSTWLTKHKQFWPCKIKISLPWYDC